LKAAIQASVRLNEYETNPIANKEKAMKKLLVLLVVLAVAGLSITAAAQEAKQTVILFQSMEDPNFPPNPAICDPAYTGFESNSILGASLWVSNTRANDGQVVKEKVRKIGTATACSLATNITPFDGESQSYFEGTVGDLHIAAAGECEFTRNALLEGGPLFAGCYMDVIPERSTEGIKWGTVVNNAIVTLMPVPGLETGSFWSIRLIWE
jgi:hypothetical protein